MPSDFTPDALPLPELCPFCVERLRRAAEHGHVDSEWARRATVDFWRQCCTDRARSLR